MRFRAALLLYAAMLFHRPALAQTAATGALAGSVTDPTGAVVPNAEIKVVNEATGETRATVTGQTGAYAVPLLAPGAYRVDTIRAGFKTAVRAGVLVSVAETATFHIQLQIGAEAERVTVEGAPEIVQHDTSALGRVTAEQVVVNLPLVTRNYAQIIGLSPGINAPVTNAAELGAGSGAAPPSNSDEASGLFVHGARAIDNNFQVDGIDVNSYWSGGTNVIPNPDTILEFKVQTGQYDASFGRNAGANVNLVTKSGTNRFHGSLFEFFRNDDLNANDFFFNTAGQKRPVLKQNQFGFALGGPIRKTSCSFSARIRARGAQWGVGRLPVDGEFSPADERSFRGRYRPTIRGYARRGAEPIRRRRPVDSGRWLEYQPGRLEAAADKAAVGGLPVSHAAGDSRESRILGVQHAVQL